MEEINIKLTNQQIRLLQDYRDKSYVMNVLMTKSYEKDIVDTYDSLIENITYVIPSDIQNNVKKIYKGTKTLPAFLNCEGDFIKRNSGELPNNMV